MSAPQQPPPALLVVAAFSRHADALVWAAGRLQPTYGPIAAVSPTFAFNQTTYYQSSMGPDLGKQFLVFHHLVPLDCLPVVKLHTNALEQELAAAGTFPEARPLNLDPGWLTLGKFQLATTKDQAHRIYLRDGIYAEVTLRFEDKEWHPNPWTYADYRQEVVHTYLAAAREHLYNMLETERST